MPRRPLRRQTLKRAGILALVALARLPLSPSVCSAQSVAPGTFEVSGVTGLTANRQSLTTVDASGQLQAADVNVTSIIFGFEGTYFLGSRFGVGGLVSHQGVSATASDRHAIARVASTYFGPLAQVRLPLGGRSTFVLVGSYGGTSVAVINQNTGVGTDQSVTVFGKYWLAGGGLSVTVTPRTSFDFGVRYQDSRFGSGPSLAKATSAGLLVSVAFSLYLGG